VATVEELEEMRARHRADGTLSAEKDAAETVYVRRVVLRAAVEVADAQSYAQTAARYGPECGHARRLLASRQRRLADEALTPWPSDPEGPDGGPAAMREAA